jgi:hypothetical protein
MPDDALSAHIMAMAGIMIARRDMPGSYFGCIKIGAIELSDYRLKCV